MRTKIKRISTLLLALALCAGLMTAALPSAAAATSVFGETLGTLGLNDNFQDVLYAVKTDKTVWKITYDFNMEKISSVQVASDVVGLTQTSTKVNNLRHDSELFAIKTDGSRVSLDKSIANFSSYDFGYTYYEKIMTNGTIPQYLKPGGDKLPPFQTQITANGVLKMEDNPMMDMASNLTFATNVKYAIVPREPEFDQQICYVDAAGNLWRVAQMFGHVIVESKQLLSGVAVPGDKFPATATPTNTAFMLHDEEVSLPAYLIDGSNYVKLRDVAALLVDRFDVRFEDGKAKLYNQATYTAVGGELTAMAAGAKKATESATEFVWGDSGESVDGLTAYLIDGNNYIKLRDIAKLFDFDVDWRDGKAWIEPDVSPYTED